MLVIANVEILCLQFCNPVLLPDVPADSTDLEGKARRSQVLAEVQGDLGRVLQARALEDPTLCVHAVLAEFLYVIPGTFMFRVG